MKQKHSSALWEEWIEVIVNSTGITGRGIGRRVEGLSEASLGNYKRHAPPHTAFILLAKEWPVILKEKAAEIGIDTSEWVELPLAEQFEAKIAKMQSEIDELKDLTKVLMSMQAKDIPDEEVKKFLKENKDKILGE